MKDLAKDSCEFEINRIEMRSEKIGIITSGIVYQYAKEAFPEASFLKLGIVHPLPKDLILDFASRVGDFVCSGRIGTYNRGASKKLGNPGYRGKNYFQYKVSIQPI